MTSILLRHHPTRPQLFAYTENLVDKRAPVSAKIAAHVAACQPCLAQVQAMRASLEVTTSAPDLQPSPESACDILVAARNERFALQHRRSPSATFSPLLRGLAYAAALVLVGALCFNLALGKGLPTLQATAISPAAAPPSHSSPEAIRKATADIQTFAAVVASPSRHPQNLLEHERRRALHALTADLAAAHEALARNPGCARATRIINTNLQRQAQALRTLYVERTL